jgi:hypothetical protein
LTANAIYNFIEGSDDPGRKVDILAINDTFGRSLSNALNQFYISNGKKKPVQHI